MTWLGLVLVQWHNTQKIDAFSAQFADEAVTQVVARFARYERELRSIRGVIQTLGVEQLDRASFERYIHSRNIPIEYPGALGFGFIRRVPVKNVDEFLLRARADGAPGFSIRSLSSHQQDRFVIQYIYPYRGNEQAVGLDIGSESNRRQAALDAARELQARLTAPITLVQADGKPSRGFLILLPIFADGVPPETPAIRASDVVGWSYAPLVVDDVLANLGLLTDQVEISIAQSGADQPFFRSSGVQLGSDAVALMTSRNITVMGQPWQLGVSPREEALAQLFLLSRWWAYAFGFSLTLVLFYLLYASRRVDRLPLDATAAAVFEPSFSRFLSSGAFKRAFPPLCVVVLGASGLAVWLLAETRWEEQRVALQDAVEEAAQTLQATSEEYSSDVLALSASPPIQVLTTASSTGDSRAALHTQVADVFSAYMLANREVYQVRLIEAASGWRESVKLHRSAGVLTRVSEDRLQSKAAEPYVAAIMGLGEGEVARSVINLNREFGTVQTPLQPVWRFSTPLFGSDGELFGLVIINLAVDGLLQQMQASAAGARLFLMNADGNFLIHPQRELAFAFQTGKATNWQQTFQALPRINVPGLEQADRWQQGGQAYWVARQRIELNQKPAPLVFTVATAKAEFPLIQATLLQGLLALVAALICLSVVVFAQYRSWWVATSRAREQVFQQSARQREKENAFFKALVDTAPDATVVVDETGHIRIASQQAQDLFGYSKSELEGMSVNALLPIRYQQSHGAHILAYFDRPQNRQMGQGLPLFAVDAGGKEFPVDVRLAPVVLEGRVLVTASIRNVTDQLEAEMAMRSALQSAKETTQAKSSFLANTSHEIRTPLNAIIGLTYLLADESLTAKQQQLVSKITTAGRSLLGIVNDVLDLAKIEASEMSLEHYPLDLRELLEELGGVFTAEIEVKNLDYQLRVDPALPEWILTDGTRLRQILLNLLSNALKFTQYGGITLQADKCPQGEGRLRDDQSLKLTVTDTGCGIAEHVIEHLFQPFAQADASTTRHFGGTGLGLSIVHKLAELMGGEVWAESEQGRGSRFFVELPLSPVAAGEVNQSNKNSALFVMVAEDNSADADALRSMARALGWRVEVLPDGEALVSAVVDREQRGLRPPDVLIVDWQMPKLDGLGAIQQLAERVSPEKLPAVLVITAHESAKVKALDTRHLVQRVIEKPLASSVLFDAVNDVVATATGDKTRVLQSTRTDAVSANWLPGVRVLVVDDSELNLDVVSQLLERNGAEVETCLSAKQALACLQHAAEFDVVLMDVQMPGMDGLEATRYIRHELNLRELPIVALTAGALVEERDKALEAGMDGYLTKPIDPSKLVNRLRLLIEHYRGEPLPVENTDRVDTPAVASKGAWPEIPGLNAEQAKRMLMGNLALFMKTLEGLLEEHRNLAEPPQDLDQDSASASASRQALAGQVHKLRSASGTVGAKRIQNLAAETEEKLRVPGEPVQALLSELAEAMSALINDSEAVIAAFKSDDSAASQGAHDAPVALSEQQLETLISQLKHNDLAGLSEIMRLKPTLEASLGAAGYAQLQTSMDTLNFRRAASILSRLRASDGGE
jgi:PAS domain S-box-containing protein